MLAHWTKRLKTQASGGITMEKWKQELWFTPGWLPVPVGTWLVLIRHAETFWNIVKYLAICAEEPIPARSDDDLDSPLSPVGRIQAVLTGYWLSRMFHKVTRHESLDNVFLSRSRRSAQTWAYMKKPWDVHAGLHTEQIPELTEIKHISDITLGQAHVSLHDLGIEGNILYKDEPPEKRESLVEEYIIVQAKARGVFRQAAKHAQENDKTDILARRKHPTGENYLEKRQRLADTFLRYYLDLLNGKSGLASLAVTHGRTYIGLRQLLEEDFSDEMARVLHKAEGRPFPPHVSLTFYREKDGYLKRHGDCYLIADGLCHSEDHPRLLDFSEDSSISPAKFHAICRVADVDLNPEVTQIPHRDKMGRMSNIEYQKSASVPPSRRVPESGTFTLTPTPPLPKVG